MPIHSPNSFGLLAFLHWNHDWNKHLFPPEVLPKAVKQIQELGVKFVRLDILWADVIAPRGGFEFGRYDPLIHLLREHGIDVLAQLQYNHEQGTAEDEKWNLPPDSPDDFASYAEATVRHFKGQIHAWEIWNEPNHPYYWKAEKDGMKRYGKLLKRTYEAAKSADPDCCILNGGLSDPLLEDVPHLYQNGLKAYFDVLSIHVFIDPQAPRPKEQYKEKLQGVIAIMNQHGDNGKKIWITEMGCPGVPQEVSLQSWFMGRGLREEDQAKWVENTYAYAKKFPRVEKVFWAFYRDTDRQFKDATDYLGLVRKDFSPKPAYRRLQALINNSRKSR